MKGFLLIVDDYLEVKRAKIGFFTKNGLGNNKTILSSYVHVWDAGYGGQGCVGK